MGERVAIATCEDRPDLALAADSPELITHSYSKTRMPAAAVGASVLLRLTGYAGFNGACGLLSMGRGALKTRILTHSFEESV